MDSSKSSECTHLKPVIFTFNPGKILRRASLNPRSPINLIPFFIPEMDETIQVYRVKGTPPPLMYKHRVMEIRIIESMIMFYEWRQSRPPAIDVKMELGKLYFHLYNRIQKYVISARWISWGVIVKRVDAMKKGGFKAAFNATINDNLR